MDAIFKATAPDKEFNIYLFEKTNDGTITLYQHHTVHNYIIHTKLTVNNILKNINLDLIENQNTLLRYLIVLIETEFDVILTSADIKYRTPVNEERPNDSLYFQYKDYMVEVSSQSHSISLTDIYKPNKETWISTDYAFDIFGNSNYAESDDDSDTVQKSATPIEKSPEEIINKVYMLLRDLGI